MSTSREVVEFLSRGDAYPDHPQHVECIQTHISWVFLTPGFAFKLKKPVKFDFLDFSTLERRREDCQEEVRINRRLAGDVYLGVVPIVRDVDGELAIGGEGETIDYVVQMRRLPAEAAMDRLMVDHALTEGHVTALADRLVQFYLSLPPIPVEVETYRRQVEQHVRANRRELLRSEYALDGNLMKRVHAAQLRTLLLRPAFFNQRVQGGRIVEGHGDLRPEHIYFTPQPVIIDGVEFNREFRQLDVLDELSFLAMECAYLGEGKLGSRIVARYCESTGDQPLAALLAFYESYRACVRAKVAALRSDQAAPRERDAALDTARKYLLLADRFDAALGPPLCIVVRGLSGTGKSVLARALAESLGCDLLQTDEIRRELFGAGVASFGEGRYQSEKRKKVYAEMLRRAERLLACRVPVVLDGTFFAAHLRQAVKELAARAGATLAFFRTWCPDEVAAERVAARQAKGGSSSEITVDLLAAQRHQDEPDPPDITTYSIDSTQSADDMLQVAVRQLSE